MTVAARREVVEFIREGFSLSERRACAATNQWRSTQRYRCRRLDDGKLRNRLIELASVKPRYGYEMLHLKLRREGWKVNHKKVYRLYREERLALDRRGRRKRVAAAARQAIQSPKAINGRWSADFMGDTLADGRAFRTFNLVDDFSRESLAIEVDSSIPAERVVRVLETVGSERGFPQMLVVDNGPEFRSRALDQWAYRRGVELHFIRPGKPIENAFVESFNGTFRYDCLNQHWFLGLNDAREKIALWRQEYNHDRPHTSLEGRPPAEYAALRSPPAPSALHIRGEQLPIST